MHYREYFRATGINVLFTFCIFLYYPILSPYIKSFGLDDFQISLIFSLLPLAIIFASPIVGKLADNFGRTKIILFGVLFQITALVLYIYGSFWWVLALARFIEAIAISSVTLIALSKVEDNLSDKNRGLYTGLSFTIQHLGAIVAPVIGGLLADYFFVKAPFLLSAFILLILGFMLVFKNKKSKKKIDRSYFNIWKELKEFLSIRQLKGMGILGIVMHSTKPATEIFLPLFIIDKLGLSFTYVGVAFFFLGVGHLFQFYFGKLTDRFGKARMVLLGCFIFAFFMFFLSVTKVYYWFLIILLFMGVGGALWNVSAWTLMSAVAQKMKKQGEIVGSYISIAKIGGFISFIFSGLIVQVFSIEVLFMFNAFLIAIGIFIASFYFDKKDVFSDKHAKHL